MACSVLCVSEDMERMILCGGTEGQQTRRVCERGSMVHRQVGAGRGSGWITDTAEDALVCVRCKAFEDWVTLGSQTDKPKARAGTTTCLIYTPLAYGR